MTRGIKVVWPDENNRIDEIEYFCGIDINDLRDISVFTSVRADWPRYEPEPGVEYNVDVRCERPHDAEVRLVVDYDDASNPELARKYPDMIWGTNTIILKQGYREGHCQWSRRGSRKHEKIRWQAFDLAETHGRPLAKYLRSRRYHRFRNIILAHDDHRCVITEETTTQALEAAHLVPARNGENDMSFNGITLRADLHRLFDARLFTFDQNGHVVTTAPKSRLSAAYRHLLRNKQRLPPATLARVRATLALAQFVER